MVPKPNNKKRRKNRRYNEETLAKTLQDIRGKYLI